MPDRLRHPAFFLLLVVLFIVIALVCPTTAHARFDIWRVDHTATSGDETGEDWPNAFLTIQDALANGNLSAGDEILVADGTYHASVLRDDRSDSIVIDAIANEDDNNIVLRGGYAGLGASNPDFFCPRTNVTRMSGDIGTADADDLDTAWDDGTRSDNSYHILKIGGVGSSTVIEGFTIEGGNADDTDFFGGAAVVEDGAEVWFIDCIFAANSAGTESGTPVAGQGGAVFIDTPPSANKVVKFLLCRFFNNTADRGGGVSLKGDDSNTVQTEATFANTIMHDNTALSMLDGTPVKPFGSGGAIFVLDHARALIVNSVLEGNTAERDAAAVATITLAFGEFEASTVVVSAIVWENRVGGNVNHFGTIGGSLNVDYSDVQGGHAGTGNIDTDPQLNTTTYIAGSSAIRNVGDPTPTDVPADVFDLDKDGNVSEKTPDYLRDIRVAGSAIDMGAYEFYQAGTCQADINSDGSVNVTDLLLLLAQWCSAGCCSTIQSPADFGHDDDVDVVDLLTL